ncbi:MAG: hypothetical protein JWR05_277 [Mucilaginibacter sp.]|nr:hypothetical protein [Mucilaginibacter sp.]
MLTFTVMKSYFIRLFNYDQFANTQINELILKTNKGGKPVQLMAHLLSAEQLWLTRCKGINTSGISSWPNWEANSFESIIESNHNEWISFLNALSESDFDKIIHYQNSTGDDFETALCDILAHVINHGTHTRAQIGQHLKRNENDKLPITDYSYYLRQLNK